MKTQANHSCLNITIYTSQNHHGRLCLYCTVWLLWFNTDWMTVVHKLIKMRRIKKSIWKLKIQQLQIFLVARTRLYKPLCRSVRRSVRQSVRPSVGHTWDEFLIFWLKWNKIAVGTWCYATWKTLRLNLNERASITWNYHLRDLIKTNTRADCQNASYPVINNECNE